ncbi:MAG: hypothetical protein WC783_00655 [Candidatus Paceibacterota bacterium]|jgi:hypothetical protein
MLGTVKVLSDYEFTNDPRVMRFKLCSSDDTPINIPVKVINGVGLSETKIDGISMVINPTELSFNFVSITVPVKTMGGFIITHWGDELDSMSASGVTPAFYYWPGEFEYIVTAPTTTRTPVSLGIVPPTNALADNPYDAFDLTPSIFVQQSGGLTVKYAILTEAFNHFMDILEIYKSNAVSLDDAGMIMDVGHVKIYYQDLVYWGNFDSFNYEIDPENPFCYKYDWTFKVRKTVRGSI